MVPLERSINIYLNLCADICCWTSIFKSLQVTFKSTFRIHVFFLLCTSCCHCSLACQVCKNRQEREAKHYSFIHRWFVNLWVPPFAGESSWGMCTCLCLTARSSWGKKKKQACTLTASRAAPELVAARLISSTSSAGLQGLQGARTLVSAKGMGELKLSEPTALAEYAWLQQEMLSVENSVSCQEKE